MNKWVFRGFLSNANFAKDPCNVTSQIDTPRNVSRENTTTPRDFSKMSQKQPKLKVIIHTFGLSRGRSFERHGMPPRAMGAHWKGVIWLGTNRWMPLRSFHDNFGFHKKLTYGVLRGFSKLHKWCQTPEQYSYKSRRLS